METSEIITLIFSGIVALSTVVYVVLTSRLVKETRILRKSQYEPQIVVYLETIEARTGILYLKVKNIGAGLAKNVKFEIIKDFEFGNMRKLKERGFFNEGIKFFPPNVEYEFLITALNDEPEKKFEDRIELKIEYESVLKEQKKDHFDLKFKEIHGQGVLEPPATYIGMIAYRLEKIQEILKNKK